jgi:ABC-type nitrate/sulfonate/bicarbonate transport system ATPase subunit
MIREGTEPVIENFSSLALTPKGICVYFQPYQVAPWAAGAQNVTVPLEALAEAGPLLRLWDK